MKTKIKAAAKKITGHSKTDPHNQHVGRKVRERRKELGMFMADLAAANGLTYQQVAKYERGINRMSAGRLFEIARVLHAPLIYFFDGLPGIRMTASDCAFLDFGKTIPAISADPQKRSLITDSIASYPVAMENLRLLQSGLG